METNENYVELKETTKTFLQMVTSNELYYALFLLIFMIAVVKIIDIIFLPMRKNRRRGMQFNLLKGCLQAVVIITIGLKICSLIPGLADFTNQILMSSSLIVVVLGFVFQEGLSNIVHGFILSIFKPFSIGDRIHATIDGESITGYIKSMDLRSTVIHNVMNSSHVIVPNSKMDLAVIDNNYYDEKTLMSTNFLDLSITYESDLEKAMRLVSETILKHPLVASAREKNNVTEPVGIMVRELGENGIGLRAVVMTLTIEENFQACSDIRRDLALLFRATPGVDFAYPHVEVVKEQKKG